MNLYFSGFFFTDEESFENQNLLKSIFHYFKVFLLHTSHIQKYFVSIRISKCIGRILGWAQDYGSVELPDQLGLRRGDGNWGSRSETQKVKISKCSTSSVCAEEKWCVIAYWPKVGGLDLLILDMRESGSGRSVVISIVIIPCSVLGVGCCWLIVMICNPIYTARLTERTPTSLRGTPTARTCQSTTLGTAPPWSPSLWRSSWPPSTGTCSAYCLLRRFRCLIC